MKSLLCAIVKNENKYLKEWIDHYKKIGFDKIILYDNNDVNGEQLNIESNDFVEIINYRGKHIIIPDNNNYWKREFKHGTQEEAYNDCYLNHSDGYDWIAYFDIDEYLIIDGKINDFLSQDIFKDADAIQINWEIYGDNDKLYYENIPLNKRFTKTSFIQTDFVKTIVKTKNPNFVSLRCHWADIKDGKYVRPNGKVTNPSCIQFINYEGAKLKHFYTKTIEEWIDRKCGTTAATGEDFLNNIGRRIDEFFQYNKYTDEKVRIIKDKIHSKIICYTKLY